ncbi:MAG: aconitase X swivel domain-containing protein [Candidatus Helarchaeota archaeon]
MSKNKQILILKGRSVVPGLKKGKALVCIRALSAAGGIDPNTGIIIESRHPQKGENVKKKILIYPNGKGSSGFSLIFHALSLLGRAPKAMIINRLNSLSALAAVVGNIPTICGPFEGGKNPLDVIKNDEKLLVDANKGLVYRIERDQIEK